MSRRSRDPSGSIFAERYRLIRRVAMGGMGGVYEATDLKLERRVAVKCMREELWGSDEATHRFFREAQVASSIPTQHVATIFDYDQTPDGTAFIVMEYLEGKDLYGTLKEQQVLGLPWIVKIVLQASWALHLAHERGVIHRDIKPSNLFISRDEHGRGLCKVLDFGVARVGAGSGVYSRTQAGKLLGTPAYMAPEQIRGQKDIDRRLDIYALGVILYECLAGRRPHEADNHHSLLYQIMHVAPAPLGEQRPELPTQLTEVVHRAMSVGREERFSDMHSFAVALEPFLLPTVANGTACPSAAGMPTEIGSTRGDSQTGEGHQLSTRAVSNTRGARGFLDTEESVPPLANDPKTAGPMRSLWLSFTAGFVLAGALAVGFLPMPPVTKEEGRLVGLSCTAQPARSAQTCTHKPTGHAPGRAGALVNRARFVPPAGPSPSACR